MSEITQKKTGLNITLTPESQEIITKFIKTELIGNNDSEIAKIAISYALGNEYDKGIDLDTYDIGKANNKWAVGTISEPYFEDAIKVFRPDVKNINIALRNLIDIGLKKMYEDLWDEKSNSFEITKLFDRKLL